MKALAEAAVARKKKKAAGIEAGAVKTKETLQQKTAALKEQKEDKGENLDQAKKASIEANFKRHEQERVAAKKASQEASKEDAGDVEKQKRVAAAFAKAEEERKQAATAAKAAKEEADRAKDLALQQEQERIAAEIARAQAERKRLADIEAAEKAAAAKLIDEEKKKRIEAAAAQAEEVRMAKLHQDHEESHKWKKPPNLGLGKGEKPPAFKTGRNSYTTQQDYESVPTLAGAGGIPQIATGQVVAEPVVKPKDIINKPAQYQAPTHVTPAAPVAPVATSTSRSPAAAPAPVPLPMEGVTQEDLKQYARKLPDVKSAEVTQEYQQTDAFVYQDPKDAFKENTPDVTTANADTTSAALAPAGAATTTSSTTANGVQTTTTTTSYTVKSEPSTPPQSGCCVIL